MDSRIYGFSICIGLSARSALALLPLIEEAADVFGQSCSGGLMGKFDGHVLLPAVVSQDGIVSGFVLTQNQMSTSKRFCVVVNYRPWGDIPGFRGLKADLKCFDGEAARELCSTSSFSDMSTELEGMRVPNLGGSGVLPVCTGYTLDRGRLVVRVIIDILGGSGPNYNYYFI
jgi:hypothetical protein